MIDGVTGDPGSCSQLGGAFRSHAARLAAMRLELVERTDRLRREPAEAATVTDLDADLRLLDAVVERLDASGAALQRFAQELAEIAEAVRRLEGVGIDDIALRRPTLDDVFLALTGHTAEEAEQDEDAEKQEVAA